MWPDPNLSEGTPSAFLPLLSEISWYQATKNYLLCRNWLFKMLRARAFKWDYFQVVWIRIDRVLKVCRLERFLIKNEAIQSERYLLNNTIFLLQSLRRLRLALRLLVLLELDLWVLFPYLLIFDFLGYTNCILNTGRVLYGNTVFKL
jgi:hypothetical protein